MPVGSSPDDSSHEAMVAERLANAAAWLSKASDLADDGDFKARLSATRRDLDAFRADAELRELKHDRQDLESAIQGCRHHIERYLEDDRKPSPADSAQHRGKTVAQVQAERDYGAGTTVEDAVARVEAELRDTEERLEAVNDEIDLLVFELWADAYPEEPLPAVDGTRDLDLEYFMTVRLLDELDESGGLFPAADYPILICSHGVVGLLRAVEAQRAKNTPKLESILAAASAYDQKAGGDVYTVFGVRPGKNDTLRVVSKQISNPQRSSCERGTRRRIGMFGVASRRRSRARSSRCSAPGRRQGSRRITSRSAGGGDSGDDPPGERAGPARRRGLLGERQLHKTRVAA